MQDELAITDHYATLGLSSRRFDASLTVPEIRTAYRAALLLYHPDKSQTSVINYKQGTHGYQDGDIAQACGNTSAEHRSECRQIRKERSEVTIDRITTAYQTLIEPNLRREYDTRLARALSSDTSQSLTRNGRVDQRAFLSGLETLDLDEMDSEVLTLDSSTAHPNTSIKTTRGQAESSVGDAGQTTHQSRKLSEDSTGQVPESAEENEEMIWFRACRCGQQRGFVVTETELEACAADGEILTECRGCSLWLRVVFAAIDS